MTSSHDSSVLRWLVAAAFVVILNETIMMNAIPRLMVDLSINESLAQWLSTAFMLTMAIAFGAMIGSMLLLQLYLQHARHMTPYWMVLVAHVALSLGLAALFTPMFTMSLGSLSSHLYSHGSSLLGATQQVAGALGIALVATLPARIAVEQSEPVAAHV